MPRPPGKILDMVAYSVEMARAKLASARRSVVAAAKSWALDEGDADRDAPLLAAIDQLALVEAQVAAAFDSEVAK